MKDQMKKAKKAPLVRKTEKKWPLNVDSQIRAGQEEYPPDKTGG